MTDTTIEAALVRACPECDSDETRVERISSGLRTVRVNAVCGGCHARFKVTFGDGIVTVLQEGEK